MIKLECMQCGYIFTDEETTPVIISPATRTDPAEWEEHCPECHSTKIKDYGIFCEGCGDVPVKDEGERCTECITCEAEERADARKMG